MLTLADIKKMAYLNDFRKGMDMQRFGDVRDFEYSIYNVNASPVAEISAKNKKGRRQLHADKCDRGRRLCRYQ